MAKASERARIAGWIAIGPTGREDNDIPILREAGTTVHTDGIGFVLGDGALEFPFQSAVMAEPTFDVAGMTAMAGLVEDERDQSEIWAKSRNDEVSQ